MNAPALLASIFECGRLQKSLHLWFWEVFIFLNGQLAFKNTCYQLLCEDFTSIKQHLSNKLSQNAYATGGQGILFYTLNKKQNIKELKCLHS